MTETAYQHPLMAAYWRQLDTRFAEVEEVFEDVMTEALSVLTLDGVDAYLEAGRVIGKLGRGVEPMLAFLEEWPSAARAVGEAALPAVMAFVMRMQKSPNGRAIAPFLQTLAPVAKRLQAAEQLQRYLDVALDFMERTTGSIHGHHTTFPSPGLPEFFAQAPNLLAQLTLAGLKNWVEYGIRNYATHPERQQDYFSLQSADARAVLQRERHGTLLVDVERKLDLYLRGLWRDHDHLVPYSTAFDELRKPVPYYDRLGIRLPDVYDDLILPAAVPPSPASGRGAGGEGASVGAPSPGPSGHLLPRAGEGAVVISGLDRYRAALAHMVGHRRWSEAQIADNWSPFQRMAVEFFEDCRVETLLMREYPGLRRIFLALHPRPVEDACDPGTTSCLRHRLAMLSRALLDPDHGYADADLNDFVARFHALMKGGEASTGEVASLALSYVARTRRPSDQFAKVHFDATVVDYRDDNRQLWKFIEAGDEEEAFDQKRKIEPGEEIRGLPPRHYPEWDYASQTYRPDWASVYEALHPAGNAADIDRLLAKHGALAKRLKKMLDLLKPQDKVRVRYQEEGSELDLDVAIRSLIDFRGGATPDPRINMSHKTSGRDIAVMLLLDLSESLNEKAAGSDQTILELSQEAVSLLAWSIEQLGDPFAIAGFHSNTRHDVRYLHVKGYGERWSDDVKARLAAMQAGYSTRIGAAMRHAAHYLSARPAEKKLMLILTDGRPSDVDVHDERLLLEDARQAVKELDREGIFPYCISLDPRADEYVADIFGRQYSVIDHVGRLPERLPQLFMALTK
ncbi:nitric oxide reductase activation protein NorD [Thiobacillus sedimenti]|uniref:VWA domain-containing protein n=1 Tax=Thiobacillus sedimenti TaxID=3110231 RepID=A0ABZ1CI98_9PROT|nr:VWA domain-containing protein [Thiobacillus sp. SCUT-2]WRS39119.1 VWA domain-containing protein [Thiobacillus sp. SCUT-2]